MDNSGLAEIIRQLAFYQGGGRPQGQTDVEKGQRLIDTVGGMGDQITKHVKNVLAIKESALKNKASEMETQTVGERMGIPTQQRQMEANQVSERLRGLAQTPGGPELPQTPDLRATFQANNPNLNPDLTIDENKDLATIGALQGTTAVYTNLLDPSKPPIVQPSSLPAPGGYTLQGIVPMKSGASLAVAASNTAAKPGLEESEAQRALRLAKEKEAATLLTPDEAIKLGVPYGTTRAQAVGLKPIKPATEGQGTTAVYANRMEQANEILNGLEKYATTANPLSFATQKALPDFANTLKSDEFQSLEQAKRNFLNSVLRRESGAVISPTEFQEGNRQYFPMPGDSEQVLAQKRQNRETAIQGFIGIAGSAYTPAKLGINASSTNPTDINSQDQDALNWANANPNDPRATEIKKRLGR